MHEWRPPVQNAKSEAMEEEKQLGPLIAMVIRNPMEDVSAE